MDGADQDVMCRRKDQQQGPNRRAVAQIEWLADLFAHQRIGLRLTLGLRHCAEIQHLKINDCLRSHDKHGFAVVDHKARPQRLVSCDDCRQT